MAELFSPATGIGISMLHNPMGASDFAVNGSYSYDDQPATASPLPRRVLGPVTCR
jgi:glucosylceramidase